MTWLWNVRLEVGEVLDRYQRIQTKTESFHIEMDETGTITQIIMSDDTVTGKEGIDGENKLIVPAFKDMHTNLNQSHVSKKWGDEGTEDNQSIEATIQLMLSNGVNHIRTHVAVNSEEDLTKVKRVKEVLAKYTDYLTYDIVALASEGILREPHIPKLLGQAINEGASILGMKNPATIDKNPEGALELILSLAKELNVDVDLHIDDQENLGMYTINYWLKIIGEQGYSGQTTFSNANGLSILSGEEVESYAEKFKKHHVQVTTVVPLSIGSPTIPVEGLANSGVPIMMGTGSFYNQLYPIGSGDILEKAKEYCEYNGMITERKLRKSLNYITQGVTALDNEGKQIWPKVGDEASFVLLDAPCSAEAVARATEKVERQLIHKGRMYSE